MRPFRHEQDGYAFCREYQRDNNEDPANPDGEYQCVMRLPPCPRRRRPVAAMLVNRIAWASHGENCRTRLMEELRPVRKENRDEPRPDGEHATSVDESPSDERRSSRKERPEKRQPSSSAIRNDAAEEHQQPSSPTGERRKDAAPSTKAGNGRSTRPPSVLEPGLDGTAGAEGAAAQSHGTRDDVRQSLAALLARLGAAGPCTPDQPSPAGKN